MEVVSATCPAVYTNQTLAQCYYSTVTAAGKLQLIANEKEIFFSVDNPTSHTANLRLHFFFCIHLIIKALFDMRCNAAAKSAN